VRFGIDRRNSQPARYHSAEQRRCQHGSQRFQPSRHFCPLSPYCGARDHTQVLVEMMNC
jgi:hypothetical protein